jgi:hypothetical protein
MDGQDDGKIKIYHPLRWRRGGTEEEFSRKGAKGAKFQNWKRSVQIRFDRTVCPVEAEERSEVACPCPIPAVAQADSRASSDPCNWCVDGVVLLK